MLRESVGGSEGTGRGEEGTTQEKSRGGGVVKERKEEREEVFKGSLKGGVAREREWEKKGLPRRSVGEEE